MFVLGHISDPHLAPLPIPRARELVGKRITGFINWHRRRRYIHDPAVLARIVGGLSGAAADHTAVTGDVANIGLLSEFSRAREWLAAIGTPENVTLVPGNHDAYVPSALAAMQLGCGEYMRGDGGEGFPFVRERGPLALIGLSSAVPTAPFMATGELGAEQLARLKPLLAQQAARGRFRVLLIHHPPVSEAARHKRLIDAAAFLALVAAQGAELVIHGHDHKHDLHWIEGPRGKVPVVGVPSASAAPGLAKDAGAFNLYRIDGSAGAWRCAMETHGIGSDTSVKKYSEKVLSA